MKCKLAGLAVASGLVAGVLVGPASADPGIGQPASPSCFGASVVSYAHQYGGVANAAAAFGLTIQEGHNIVRSGCGRTSGFPPTP